MQRSYNNTPSVYVIPTPIGNLEDITLRAINILKSVDVIFAEDTRVAKELLRYLNIDKKVLSSHEHNEVANEDKLLDFLHENLNVGIVTDRGTPIISDPGYVLVRCAIANNFNVISLPGATALIPALTSSGIVPSPFMFIGFLNNKGAKVAKELMAYKDIKATLLFYESPNRLVKTLNSMLEVFGDRNVSVAREISKKFESYYRGPISKVLKELPEEIKGEIVIVVEGNTETTNFDNLSILEHLELYISEGMDSKEAIKLVAKERKIPKSVVYMEHHKK